MGYGMELLNKTNLEREVSDVVRDNGVRKYMEEIRKIKCELNGFLNSESCRISGTIKKTVLDFFEEIQGVVGEIANENGKLVEKVEKLESEQYRGISNNVLGMSYSKVLSGTSRVRTQNSFGENRLVVTANENFKGKGSEEVKNALLTELEGDKGRLKIRTIRKLKDKAVVMELDSKEDLEQVVKCVSKSKVLCPKVQGRMNPRVIVYNVERTMNEEDLIKGMIEMNLGHLGSYEDLKSEIKVIFKTKSRVRSWGDAGAWQLSGNLVNTWCLVCRRGYLES